MKAVNLLPSDQRSVPKPTSAPAAKSAAPAGGAFGAYVVLGALAFAVVAVASYVMVGNQIKDRKADLARVQADAQSVQSQVAALKPYYDFQQLATKRVATVMSLAGSRFDWERALRDVSQALPRDVHLKTLRGSVSNGAGGGSNALRGSISAPAIELSGCTTSQGDVARLMSRLRAVRGVTRVSLSKSDKGQLPVAGAAATGAEQGKLCDKKAPPAFEMVVFFERANVAPPSINAVPGTTAPGTTAPGTTPNTTQPAQPAPSTAQPAQPGQPAPSTAAPTTQGVSAP
jgi:Tfp pilus assembly protein PilN